MLFRSLRDFLEIRFGPLPLAVASRIASFSDAAALHKLALAAYQAESLQAFLDQLPKNDTRTIQ